MPLRFQFRRYRVPFRVPIRTAHGLWEARDGVLIRLTDGSDTGSPVVAFGEAAPIPWFGTESTDEIETECRALGEWVDEARLEGVPPQHGCLRSAIGAARKEIARQIHGSTTIGRELPDYLPVAALLPAGRAALARIMPQLEIGFRVFKWKVGVEDVADELVLFDDVCAALPPGAKLRLDANGAWDRRKAERWLERCAERSVEFVEQPCFAPASDGAKRQRQAEDLLLGLAADFPTPLALDESLIGGADIERWISAGWPGVFVLKPSLIGDLAAAAGSLLKAKAKVVFSSALETAVGGRTALRAAFAWQGEPLALGFGVWPLFSDPRYEGPVAAPFIRREDVERLNPEVVWNAVS